MSEYALIHIVIGGEFRKPLVASQVFDHAQTQAELDGPDAPAKVGVWLFEPLRELWSSETRQILRELRRRCPAVDVRLIGGSGRFKSWPALPMAAFLRRTFYGRYPVVYHCRSESASPWGERLRERFPSDAVVLDIRGAWPIEMLYERGITDPVTACGKDRDDYESAVARLRRAAKQSDAMTTVSRPLLDWLQSEVGQQPRTAVVPCCVKRLIDDVGRSAIRDRWRCGDGIVLIYSGTTAAYQGLDELTLPFMRAAQRVAKRVWAALLTPNVAEMRSKVRAAGLDPGRTIVEHVPQPEVAQTLAAADAGLLLRTPSVLNRFSQPTKLGEYLAAGLPVIVEKGTGEVPDIVERAQAGLGIACYGLTGAEMERDARRVIHWLSSRGAQARAHARGLAAVEFTWTAASPRVRELYVQALRSRARRDERSSVRCAS